MHWFGGSMAEAVTLSKQKNAIFVVFVEGDNDLSKELATAIDDGAVMKRLANEHDFLAVKLKSGSENYTFFAQIYQFVPVPSLFFIGRNGTPLEVVCAGIEPHNLATRIDRILQEHRKDQPNSSVQPSALSSDIKDQTSDFLQSEAATDRAHSQPEPVASGSSVTGAPTQEPTPKVAEAPAKKTQSNEELSGPAAKIAKTVHNETTKSGVQYEVVCDGDVCVRRPKPDQPGPSAHSPADEQPPVDSESSVSLEDKMEKAKELIEIRRREKADKEKELEKQKELERRNMGQGVAELKKWQAEQELKQIQEERKREKMENNLARQRILEQIAQDRAERKAREHQPPPAAPVTPPSAALGDAAGRARVQFKLPDGRAHTAHFACADTLADLQRYVADNLQLSASSFSLWTAFPRRELVERDASLLQLQLAPSAALLVLLRAGALAAAPEPSPFAAVFAFFSQLFTSLVLDPSYQIYSWLHSRFFASRPANPPGSPTPASPTSPTSPANPSLRRRGNIHRLTGDRSRDDDNNTWNGNSTQQM